MIDALVDQVRRLFSSKNNGGRLVFKLTDRLHHYKQVLLATSIVLLLGYAQFRPHFQCEGLEKVNEKTLTNFCWINGTHTLDLKADSPPISSSKTTSGQRSNSSTGNSRMVSNGETNAADMKQSVIGRDESASFSVIRSAISQIPHVGMQFKPGGKAADKYVLVGHNYMRSLWTLLILMAACSFFAQRAWSSIFRDDTLRALLKLPGHKDLTIVAKAQEARAYEKLMKLPGSDEDERLGKQATLLELFKGSQLCEAVEILVGEANEYNRLLEYYPNQLIYFLISKRTRTYKLSALKLKRSIMIYSISSFCLTLMQFMLPLIFIGDKYALYGWKYFKAWLSYLGGVYSSIMSSEQTTDSQQQKHPINSIDYEISGQIWPVSTICHYKQYGYQGLDTFTVNCSVPINEICAKLFLVIWWFVAINLAIEFYSLCSVLAGSANFRWTECVLGRRYWPKARSDASAIANFRFLHTQALDEQLKKLANGSLDSEASGCSGGGGKLGGEKAAAISLAFEANRRLNDQRRKAAEAARDRGRLVCSHNFLGRRYCREHIDFENLKGPADEDGFCETRKDSNIYFLFYLLHMRLGNSRRRTEQVLRMTAEALGRYLASLSKLEESRERQASGAACQLVIGAKNGAHSTSMPSSIGSDSSDRDTVIEQVA